MYVDVLECLTLFNISTCLYSYTHTYIRIFTYTTKSLQTSCHHLLNMEPRAEVLYLAMIGQYNIVPDTLPK